MAKTYQQTYDLISQFSGKTFRSQEIQTFITANDLSIEEVLKAMFFLNIGVTPSNNLEYYLYSINQELRILNNRYVVDKQ